MEFWRAIKLDLYDTLLGFRFGIPELIKAGGGSGDQHALECCVAVVYAPHRVRPCDCAIGLIRARARVLSLRFSRCFRQATHPSHACTRL
jgi:hypothetical protein